MGRAFQCFLHLETGNSRDQCEYKRKRTRDSISPTFPLLFLWELILHHAELHFYDLLVLPLLDKGREGWRRDFAYMRTCHGSVLKIRMACKVLIIEIIRMVRDSSPRGENVSVLNGNGEKAMPFL